MLPWMMNRWQVVSSHNLDVPLVRCGSWITRARVRVLGFAFCAILIGLLQTASAANLLQNGAFETENEGKPVGWERRPWAGDGTTELVRPGHKGQRCAMIASATGADFSLATNVAVKPYATYRLSGWIKTENVQLARGRGAFINVHDIYMGESPALAGTQGWTHVEVVFNTFGQDHVWVHCCLGGWGQVSGKAWYDDLVLEQLNRYDVDYSYLFEKEAPGSPHIAFYGGKTGIADHPFEGPNPSLAKGRKPVRWRLAYGPDGMTVDSHTGAPSWQKPTLGRHRVLIEAKNPAGRDLMEFFLIVVKNDIPAGLVVETRYMDFVLPPEGVRWFAKWRPHATLDAQFSYLRKLIGHEPARDGKQIVKYHPVAGCGGCSGNPVTVGPGFWNWDDVGGWIIGIWFHEVGHNFNAQAPVTFYSDLDGYGDAFHHHCHFLAESLFLRTAENPKAFGLVGQAAVNYQTWMKRDVQGLFNETKDYSDWLKNGGSLHSYGKSHFHLWATLCNGLAAKYGVEVLETSLRAMRTDGIPASLRERAKTPPQVNALQFCAMSHAAGTDLRPFFKRTNFEFDDVFYDAVDTKVKKIVKNLPDEDDLGGWKRNPNNGHYYRRTTVDTDWYAAEVEARQFGGHLATIRNIQEAEWLQSRFGIYPYLWIGFQDAEKKDMWKWSSGDDSKFVDWDRNQPESRRFATLATQSGKWQAAISANETFPGIIEAETKPRVSNRKSR